LLGWVRGAFFVSLGYEAYVSRGKLLEDISFNMSEALLVSLLWSARSGDACATCPDQTLNLRVHVHAYCCWAWTKMAWSGETSFERNETRYPVTGYLLESDLL
jgi:hypothetical protein